MIYHSYAMAMALLADDAFKIFKHNWSDVDRV